MPDPAANQKPGGKDATEGAEEHGASHETRAVLRMHRTSEVQRTARTGIVAITVILSLAIIVAGAVLIATENAWMQALGIGGGVICAGTIPTVFYFKARAFFKARIKDEHGRVIELEGELGAGAQRSSSELKEDGTNRPEDLI